MVYLVLSLSVVPFINAEVYSAAISGADGAESYIRGSDTVKVESSTLLPALVDFNNAGNFTAMSCDSSTPTRCTYSRAFNNLTSQLKATVKESGSLQTKQLTAYVDLIAPAIDSVSFTGIGWGVRASYTISDRANVQSAGKCSGFKKIELLVNGKSAATQTLPVGQCTATGSIEGTLPNMIGSVNASLAVYDYVGLKAYAVAPQSYNIESKLPKISSSVGVYVPGTETRLTSVPPNSTVKADIRISVTDESMGDDVFADLSEVGAGANVDASCSVESNASACTFAGVSLKIPKTGAKVVFFARDNAGNLANLTTTLPLTISPPKLSFRITALRAGTERNVTVMPGPNATKPLNADLYFDVSYDSPVLLDRLEADFSELSPGSKQQAQGGSENTSNSSAHVTSQSWQSEKCEQVDEKRYTCKFSGVQLQAKKTGGKANVTSVDISGGKYTVSTTLPLSVVNSAGTVTSLSPLPEHCYGGKCYMGRGQNRVIAQISTQSSFEDLNIVISGVKPACNATLGLSCTANVPGSGVLSLTGSDDFGQAISATSTTPVVFDGSAPEFKSDINVTPECVTSSETLTVIANVTDSGGSPTVIIKADTLSISSSNLSTAACTRESENSANYVCVLPVSGIKDMPINTNLKVIVEDLAGNQVSQDVPVSVCTVSDQAPDFIRGIDPVGTVPKVDRKVASRLPVKLPISMNMELADTETYILQRSLVSCAQTPGAGEAYYINELSESPLLLVDLTYNPQWDNSSNLTLQCVQQFKVRHQNVIYTQPENELITANIILFNQPLGTLNETYTAKITQIKGDLRDLDKRIASREKWQKYLGKFCGTVQGIAEMNAKLQRLKPIIYSALLVVNVFSGGLADRIWVAYVNIADTFKAQVDSYIWPQGWFPTKQLGGGANPKVLSNTIGLVVKYTCTVYTCKFYDMGTLFSISLDYVAWKKMKQEQQSKQKSEIADEWRKQLETVNPEFLAQYSLTAADLASLDDEEIQILAGEYIAAGGDSGEWGPAGSREGIEPPKDTQRIMIADDGQAYQFDCGSLASSGPTGASITGLQLFDTQGGGSGCHSKPIDYLSPEDIEAAQAQQKVYRDKVTGQRYLVYSDPGSNSYEYYTLDDKGEITPIRPEEVSFDVRYAAGQRSAYQQGAFPSADRTVFYSADGNVRYVYKRDGKNGWVYDTTYDNNQVRKDLEFAMTSYRWAYDSSAEAIGSAGKKAGNAIANAPGRAWNGFTEATGFYYWPQGFGNSACMHGIRLFGALAGGYCQYAPNDPRRIAIEKRLGVPTGRATGAPAGNTTATGSGSGVNLASDDYLNMGYRLNQAVDTFIGGGDDGSWLYNPYKSKNYDKFCIPATLFNDKKERQLLCKRLVCLQEMAATGGPLDACEFDYNLDYCLYVESARSHIEDSGFLEKFGGAMLHAVMGNLIGVGVTYAYTFTGLGCKEYQSGLLSAKTAFPKSLIDPRNAKSLFCGLQGALISGKELRSVFDNPYNPFDSQSSAPTEIRGEDFCIGVNYQE